MDNLKKLEVWFVTGTQHLYGPETLKQVAADSTNIAAAFDKNPKIPVKVVFKPIMTTPDSITELCTEANNSKQCVGLICWMHTFSPAKMWIKGLNLLNKPFLHLDPDVVARIAVWVRVASAYNDALNMKVARFGDNMRDVAVTEGNKVSAQIKMGYSVYGYGIGDLVKCVNEVSPSAIKKLLAEYGSEYKLTKAVAASDTLKEAARIELGMEEFLDAGSFKAFTTTFEDLYGLKQLPGLAVQRLMAKGYGFGAEGDWKTAALVRSMKVMSIGLKGGTSFMEDYTYHFDPKGMRVLGAHMLEVCPTIALAKPSVEIHPLSIGGKEDPARLVFKTAPGNAINVSVIDLGNRFRMIVNEVEVVKCPDMPNLPVASVLWKPLPDLKRGAAAWIMAGGAHHTGFSTSINSEYLEDFAGMMGVEYVLIGEKCDLASFKNELKWNEVYYHISEGIF